MNNEQQQDDLDYWFDRKECFSCGNENLEIETMKDGAKVQRCKGCGIPNAYIKDN